MENLQAKAYLTDEDREKFIMDNIKLVYKFAQENLRYLYLYENDKEDFIQELTLKYLKCIKSFNRDIACLSTYCYKSFKNDIKVRLRKRYSLKGDGKIQILGYAEQSEDIEKFYSCFQKDICDTLFEKELIDNACKYEYIKIYFQTGSSKKASEILQTHHQNITHKMNRVAKKIKKEYGII